MDIKSLNILRILAVFVNLLAVNLKISKCFNLDVQTPIIKHGPKGSYFGFSLAYHIISVSENDEVERMLQNFSKSERYKYKLLVGAPNDVPVNSSIRTGSLYRCPITSKKTDCTIIDLKIDYQNKNEVIGQWFGATVVSQNKPEGRAMVCAPRYRNYQDHLVRGEGRCILMANNLRTEMYIEPCRNRFISDGYKMYAHCQAGFGTDITEDEEVLVGAPGSINWRGMSFYKSINNDIEDFTADNHFKNVPHISNNSWQEAVPSFSYLGMSGKIAIMNNRTKTFILGGPRSMDLGQVILIQMDPSNKSYRGKKQNLLTGQQLGSGFGHAVVVIDINSDGLNDIAVSAPFEYGEYYGGAVYVYYNSYKGINDATKPKKIIIQKVTKNDCTLVNCIHSRFGSSIANIGDIDSDGFPDLAVGAPYEGEGGVVYIYRGSKLGLIDIPSQRITPQMFGQKIQTFGYSIIGGTDIDGNNYPDIVVGNIESASLVVFRSRPVLNITASLTASKEYIEIQQFSSPDRIKESIFSLKVCFTFDSKFQKNHKNNAKNMPKRFKYSIESETLTGTLIPRVYFFAFNGSSSITHSLKLQKHKAPQCENYNVFLNKNNKDFLNPLKFHLSYDLDNSELPAKSKSSEKLNDINQHPILDIHCENVTKSVHFRKNCVKSVKCISNLKVSANIVKSEETSKNEYKILVGQKKDLLLDIKVTNNDEEAHEAMLFVYLPEQIKYKGTDDQGKNYQCEYENNVVSCLIGNPMPGVNHQLTCALRLDPSDLKPDRQNINITVAVNTTSAELDISDDSFTLFLKVIVQAELEVIGSSSPSDVYFGGEIKGEQAMVSEEDIGNLVIHSYEIKVLWGGLVKTSTLEIEWPYELTNHKHLLYLVDIEYEGDVVCNDESLNKLQYRRNRKQLDEHLMSHQLDRVKRNVRMTKEPKMSRYSEDYSGKMIPLDCDRGTAVCINITCHIGALTSGNSMVVKLISRLWNTTFLQDFMTIDKIRVFSKARVTIDPSLNIQQMETNNDVFKANTTIMPDQNLSRPKKVELWIIIAAVCAGVLLLLIFMLVLWKCGFFNRSRHDEALVHQAKVVNQPLNQQL